MIFSDCKKTFTGYVLLRENTVCGIILKRSITFLADIKRAVFKNVELL